MMITMDMTIKQAIEEFRQSGFGSQAMTLKEGGELIAFVCPEYAEAAMDAIADCSQSQRD